MSPSRPTSPPIVDERLRARRLRHDPGVERQDRRCVRATRLAGVRKHAPHLIDAEVGNVLRRHEREARLSSEEALLALRATRALVDHRYPHIGPLAELAWTWRHNLSFYDALYVALAVLLDLPLVTGDIRLSRAPDLSCTIELV